MISKTDLEKLMKKKDETIIFHHKKKDIDALKKSLEEFEEEYDEVKNDFGTVNYLLNLVENHPTDNMDDITKEIVKHEHLNTWLEKTKTVFEKLHLRHADELNVSDKEFIKTEKAKLLSEHESLERQLHSLDLIMAKTKYMLTDLQENLCKDLTGGSDIEAVGKKLLEKFGKETKDTTYTDGMNQVVKFLEDTYSVNKIKSNSLFDILENSKIIEYIVDTTTLENIEYYNYDEIGTDWIQLWGTWKINLK